MSNIGKTEHRAIPYSSWNMVIAGTEALTLVLIQCIMLWGFWDYTDLHYCDEAAYLEAGQHLVRGDWGFFRIEWGPLYSFFVGLIDLLPLGVIPTSDIVHFIACIGCTLALWWSCRIVFPSSLAFLLSVWLACNPILLNLHARPYGGLSIPIVNFTCFFLALIGLGLAIRGRHFGAALTIAAMFLCRTESALTATGVTIAFLSAGLISKNRSNIRQGCLYLVLTLVLLGTVLLHPDIRYRSFWAFRQSYSIGVWERNGFPKLQPGDQPYDLPDKRVRISFPTAESIPGAIFENPKEVFRHVWLNFGKLPDGLGQLFVAGISWCPWIHYLVLSLGSALLLLGLIRCRGRLGAVFGILPREGWLFALSGFLNLTFLMFIRPLPNHMYPVYGLGALFLGCILLAGWRSLKFSPLPHWVHFWLPVFILFFAFALPSPFPVPGNVLQPTRSATRILHELIPAETDTNFRVLGMRPWAWKVFCRRSNMTPLSLSDLRPSGGFSGTPFCELVSDLQPDILIVTPALLEEEWSHPGLAQELLSDRWERIDVRAALPCYGLKNKELDFNRIDLVKRLNGVHRATGGPVREDVWIIKKVKRATISQHPPSRIAFKLDLPKDAWFHAFPAIHSNAWDKPTDGVLFLAWIRQGNQLHLLVRLHLDPAAIIDHRLWKEVRKKLPVVGPCTLELETRAGASPQATADYDWAGWGDPRIISP